MLQRSVHRRCSRNRGSQCNIEGIMIAYLDGTITQQEADGVLLDIGGVGYRVFVARQRSEIGEKVRLWIAEIIREEKHDLYGFYDRVEQALFEQLMSVSGVGPKLAQKILSVGNPDDVVKHIQMDDVAFLTSISGVGKKTAQKIILDLKGVLVLENASDPMHKAYSEVSDALEGLGYSKQDVSEIAKDIIGETVEARVKSALRLLSRHV